MGAALFTALLWVDKFINRYVLWGRWETISANAHRARSKGEGWGIVVCGLLEALDKDHCTDAFHSR